MNSTQKNLLYHVSCLHIILSISCSCVVVSILASILGGSGLEYRLDIPILAVSFVVNLHQKWRYNYFTHLSQFIILICLTIRHYIPKKLKHIIYREPKFFISGTRDVPVAHNLKHFNEEGSWLSLRKQAHTSTLSDTWPQLHMNTSISCSGFWISSEPSWPIYHILGIFPQKNIFRAPYLVVMMKCSPVLGMISQISWKFKNVNVFHKPCCWMKRASNFSHEQKLAYSEVKRR
jgi:hypothetical protein